MPGIEVEVTGYNAVEQLSYRPRFVAAPNSLMIGSKVAVVRDAGTMLKQLAQRVRPAIYPFVESAIAACDQLESRRGQCSFREAPPRDARQR